MRATGRFVQRLAGRCNRHADRHADRTVMGVGGRRFPAHQADDEDHGEHHRQRPEENPTDHAHADEHIDRPPARAFLYGFLPIREENRFYGERRSGECVRLLPHQRVEIQKIA
jgi:hypothetical protein